MTEHFAKPYEPYTLDLTDEELAPYFTRNVLLDYQTLKDRVIDPLVHLSRDDFYRVIDNSVDMSTNSTVRLSNKAFSVVSENPNVSNSSFYLLVAGMSNLAHQVYDSYLSGDRVSEINASRASLFVALVPFYVEALRQWGELSEELSRDAHVVMRGWNRLT